MARIESISTDRAPQAIGPYSQGIKTGNLVFTAGQIALDPVTGEVVGSNDVRLQAHRVLENLAAVLQAGGASLGSVIKTTVFLADMNDFATVNEVYAEFFGDHKPARSAVEAARLPKDVLVEIEAIALSSAT